MATLHAELTSEQIHQSGLQTIAVVAVLIANVTFLAWAQPPGGNNPYWQGCNYPYFNIFQLLNGLAFLLSLLAVMTVTFFPLLLKLRSGSVMQQASRIGLALLLLATAAVIAAFMVGALVSINYDAPSPNCAAVPCVGGGVSCTMALLPYKFQDMMVLVMDPNLVVLNHFGSSQLSPVLCYGNYTAGVSPPGCELSGGCNLKAIEVACGCPSSQVPNWACGSLDSSAAANLSSVINFSPADSALQCLQRPDATETIDVNITDIINQPSVVSYSSLRYFCWNSCYGASSLCDKPTGEGYGTPDIAGPQPWLSVAPDGTYFFEQNIVEGGGLMFGPNPDIIVATTCAFFCADGWGLVAVMLLMSIGFAFLVIVLVIYLCAKGFEDTELFGSAAKPSARHALSSCCAGLSAVFSTLLHCRTKHFQSD